MTSPRSRAVTGAWGTRLSVSMSVVVRHIIDVGCCCENRTVSVREGKIDSGKAPLYG